MRERPYLTLDLSSSRIQMAALGDASTSFCFVIRQLLGFFPGQVHLSEVPFDDIYPNAWKNIEIKTRPSMTE